MCLSALMKMGIWTRALNRQSVPSCFNTYPKESAYKGGGGILLTVLQGQPAADLSEDVTVEYSYSPNSWKAEEGEGRRPRSQNSLQGRPSFQRPGTSQSPASQSSHCFSLLRSWRLYLQHSGLGESFRIQTIGASKAFSGQDRMKE